jgi:uroporphyrinogen-III synthase
MVQEKGSMKASGITYASQPQMRVLVTRPAHDAHGLTAALRQRGHDAVLAPMMTITPTWGTAEQAALLTAKGWLCTSSNGVRQLADMAANLDHARHLPLFAVGDATGRTAAALGFQHIITSGGDVQALTRTVLDAWQPAQGRLIHICGRDVAGDLAGALQNHGYDVEKCRAYCAKSVTSLPKQAIENIENQKIDAALFLSPRTARIFVRLVQHAGIDAACRNILYIALSPAVAAALRPLYPQCDARFRNMVHVAAAPSQLDLLAAYDLALQ